ncbi:peroxisomal hydratase-dehydrogenase-epimerase-like [Chelonus insularis]|uniref:peroxisomal hydratase-dehydrogenase-epimerase-like n=1 Tax=Chelonus insularis TaxID=460826 RepID=UPI00158BB11C|nr:peroxisomal hydratase-dehydrogenase-epimerase-like [Chelonus insularis]
MQIKDKKAIIVGAIGRFGIHFCRELLRNGAATVVIIGNGDNQENTLNQLNEEFGQKKVTFVLCDLSNSSDFDAIFKETVRCLGGLDILINNADLIDETDITKSIDVNVTAVIRSTLLGVQQMEKDLGGKGGIIVNITTIFGLKTIPQLPIYSSAKQAVLSFSRSFSQPYHYNKTGVKIVMYCPGFSEELEKNVETTLEKLENESVIILPQKAETVAHGLMYLIRCAQNGSIWISENGQPVYEIQLPDVLPQKQDESELLNFECIEFIEIQNRKGRRSSAEEKARELAIIKGLVCGKNVIITGGASGLGYSFVNHFLQHGAKKVAIIDVDEEAGKQAVSAVSKSYGEDRIIFINADTSNYSQILDSFTQLSSLMDSIDIVINNAGILDERRWEKEISINMNGMLLVATLAIRFMGKDHEGNGGILVNVAQYFDFKLTAQLPIYTATKFAIIGLSQSLGAPYRYNKTGVRVIAICPGLTETALTINSPNRLLSRIMKADFVKNLENLSIQTPYVVADGLMSILKSGTSGSIWVIENGRSPFEVYTPNYKTLRRQYKNNFIPTTTLHTIKGRPTQNSRLHDDMRTRLTSCA